MKTTSCISLALVALALIFSRSAFAFDNSDFQIWHTQAQEFNLNEKSMISLSEEVQFGDNAHIFFDHEYEIGYTYKLKPFLSLGARYCYLREKDDGNKFLTENRPQIEATFKWKAAGFSFTNRNRFQYRNFDYKHDCWQYRNKIKVELPWKFTRFEIQPFVADEGYFNFEHKSFAKNRFYSGIKCALAKNVEAEFYYLLEHCREDTIWPRANIFGSELILSF
jgi:hypothetical protein